MLALRGNDNTLVRAGIKPQKGTKDTNHFDQSVVSGQWLPVLTTDQ
jgi:hypothetical protein